MTETVHDVSKEVDFAKPELKQPVPVLQAEATTALGAVQTCPCPRSESWDEKALIALAGSLPGFVAALLVVGIGYWVNTKIEDRKHRNERLRLDQKLVVDRRLARANDARKRFRDAMERLAQSVEALMWECHSYEVETAKRVVTGGDVIDIQVASLATAEAAASVYADDEILRSWLELSRAYEQFVGACVDGVIASNRWRQDRDSDARYPAEDLRVWSEVVRERRVYMHKKRDALKSLIRSATAGDRTVAVDTFGYDEVGSGVTDAKPG